MGIAQIYTPPLPPPENWRMHAWSTADWLGWAAVPTPLLAVQRCSPVLPATHHITFQPDPDNLITNFYLYSKLKGVSMR